MRLVFLLLILSVLSGMLCKSLVISSEESFLREKYFVTELNERLALKELPLKMIIYDNFPDEFLNDLKNAQETINSAAGVKVYDVDFSKKYPNLKTHFSEKNKISGIGFYSEWEEARQNEQARTTLFWLGEDIVEVDIGVNTKIYQFTNNNEFGKMDIETILLHELLHGLGFTHCKDNHSLMSTTKTHNEIIRTLSKSDLRALRIVYGKLNQPLTIGGN